MAEDQNKALRIVLVGKTGSGKSATGNTILGTQKFLSRVCAQAVTKTCQKETREWNGRDLVVVDTPGLFDTKEKLETTCTEISRCVLASCPGPHAIIMVMQLGRYTEEEQKTIALIKAVFREEAMKHMMILFTRKDELDGRSLNDFLAEADVNLKSIIKECGGRCFAINNRADQAEKEAQVQELVAFIERMVQDNEEAYFSHPIYKDTEHRLKDQAKLLVKIYTEQLQKEIELIEESTKSEQEKKKDIEHVRIKYDEKIKNVREEAESVVFGYLLNTIKKIISSVWQMFWK